MCVSLCVCSVSVDIEYLHVHQWPCCINLLIREGTVVTGTTYTFNGRLCKFFGCKLSAEVHEQLLHCAAQLTWGSVLIINNVSNLDIKFHISKIFICTAS